MARRVTVLFREALAPEPDVELFIYGHSADEPKGTTNIFCYWGPRQGARRYSLGAVRARVDNRDGVAVGAVAREVLQQPRYRQIVLIVLSDGLPHADRYQGDAALRHTRRVVRSLRGVHVIHVSIDIAASGSRICDAAFSFTSLPQLVRQMRELFEGLLSRA